MGVQKGRGRKSNVRPPDLACTLTPFRPAQMTAAETCPGLSGTTTTAGLTGRRRFIVVLYLAQSESHRTLNGTPLVFKHCSNAALEQLQEPLVFLPKALEPRAATTRNGEMCMLPTRRRTGDPVMREVFGQRVTYLWYEETDLILILRLHCNRSMRRTHHHDGSLPETCLATTFGVAPDAGADSHARPTPSRKLLGYNLRIQELNPSWRTPAVRPAPCRYLSFATARLPLRNVAALTGV